MITERRHAGHLYVLSNENLKADDKVYPVSNGRTNSEAGYFVHEKFDFRDFVSGFPDEPHIILNLNHSDYKPYEVRTSSGYGPAETYFKIISKTKIDDRIKVRPAYCHAWTAKNSDKVMCNSVPCCGFCVSDTVHEKVIAEKSFVPEKHGMQNNI